MEIKNKVTAKFYGDKELQDAMIGRLKSAGLETRGGTACGNPYTTKTGKTGFASTVTFFFPEDKEDE